MTTGLQTKYVLSTPMVAQHYDGLIVGNNETEFDDFNDAVSEK